MSRERIRVFVADDSADLCQMIKAEIVNRRDMELVGMAANGEEALQGIIAASPHVVILDLIMPMMDGIGVLEKLNELFPNDQLNNRPKVIILTALGEESLTRQVLNLGANYYIIKPFEIGMLLTRVWQVAHEPGKYRSLAEAQLRTQNIEGIVTDLLRQMGIPQHFKGFLYLREAIVMVVGDDRLLQGVMTHLYALIAERYKITVSQVERSVRHSIDYAWNNGDLDLLYEIFGSTVNEYRAKPTNVSFIAQVSDMIRVSLLAG